MNHFNWPISKKKKPPHFGGPQYNFFLFQWEMADNKLKKPHTLKASQYNFLNFSVKWKWKQTKDFESKSFTPPKLKKIKKSSSI